MPLQPRRTWSAEDERRRRLEEDPDAYDVGPHTVTCAGCHRPIRLNATGRYYAANWNKHKMGCKNTNAVNGASAMSAESKFTGRVAAFRVAKPVENSESHILSIVSGNPTVHDLDHLQPQAVRVSHLQPPFGGQSTSPAEVHTFTDTGLPAAGHYTKTSTFQHDHRTSMADGAAYDRKITKSFDGNAYPRAHAFASRSLDGDGLQPSSLLDHVRRPLRSPNGPSSRQRDREAYGYIAAPFRDELEQRTQAQSSRGIPKRGIRRSREDSNPLHHSEDPFNHAAYLRLREALPESQFMLHKGKARDIDYNGPDMPQYSPRRRNALLNHDLHQQVVSDRYSRMYDGDADMDSHYSRAEVSESGSPSSRARTLEEGHGVSEFDSSSSASSPEFGVRRFSRSQRAVKSLLSYPPLQAPSRFADRVLPPLSSLSVPRKVVYSGTTSETMHSRWPTNKEAQSRPSDMVSPESSPAWRERTRAWVQTGMSWPKVSRDSPESVVLPPIRSASMPPVVVPTGTRRRQRKGGELDDSLMDEDRPSAQKVVVLPLEPSDSSSTARADDLSFKYKHETISSDEDTNVGGDSIFEPHVGNQSQSNTTNLKGARREAARLHPVWKWEHRVNPPESSGMERDSDDMTEMG